MSARLPSYEYGFITAPLAPRAGPIRMGAAEIGAALAGFSAALPDALGTLDGGGWEALSHDLLHQGDELIVSVMIRRVERPTLLS